MNDPVLERELAELSSAEELLEHFGVPYDLEVLQVHRLHILQRFHDYLAAGQGDAAELLARAYGDFVRSDARTEKVFRVFQQARDGQVTIPLASLRARLRHADPV
jgi:nitrogenase-stabilizing/protective protein